ncbi:MAG TPA: glycosyltransferase [Gemmatimonadaceae bacterium]
MRKPRIAFLARELGYGGAERQLVLLARGLAAAGWEVAVITFYASGHLGDALREDGVRLRPLHKRGRWDLHGFARSLGQVLAEEQPALLHSYLVMPNVVAAMAHATRATRVPVVWGVRASDMDWRGYDWLRHAEFLASRALARIPRRIIYNSAAGRRFHEAHGYPRERGVVIPNAIDTDAFFPDAAARARVRLEWAIAADAPLVGMLARLDPMKGHATFLEAARRVAARHPDARFVLVGDGDRAYAESLRAHPAGRALGDRLTWAGARPDAQAVLNALDLLVMASAWGEGFPNVIGEAMACGVPCVATDCGDAALVMGDTGAVVPIGDAAAMADAIVRVIGSPVPERRALGDRARARVATQFTAHRLLATTTDVLTPLLHG